MNLHIFTELALSLTMIVLIIPSVQSHSLSENVTFDGGLSTHFVYWLNESGYEYYGFNRTDLHGGSFGGRSDDNDVIVNQPVIFIHGNGDLASGTQESN